MYNTHILYKGSIILSNNKTLAQQFKTFYQENKPNTLEEAVEKFTIFGGVEWDKIDTSKPSYELIEKLILPDYRYIRNDITELTTGLPLYHSILTAIAMGDGKTHSVYKRAKVNEEVGQKAVIALVESGIIKVIKAKNSDDRLQFKTPFMRFWFAFISPLFKGVRDGEFSEVKKRWENRQSEFIQQTFLELSKELVRENLKGERVMNISSYFDNDIEIDIYTKTKSGKTIVGSAKYTNSKVKKSELTRLEELCKEANIQADIFVIVSKVGFSSELKTLKGENLKLFTLKNFKSLVE
ncbi:DUF234 domain-containing protein [Sulfurimonas sp.]